MQARGRAKASVQRRSDAGARRPLGMPAHDGVKGNEPWEED